MSMIMTKDFSRLYIAILVKDYRDIFILIEIDYKLFKISVYALIS
jgi:hypothetical protein